MKRVLLPALLLLAECATAQHVWKVNCHGGPGVDFTDLPQAVAAAAPGDEIRVYHTIAMPCVNYYTAPVIDKPLRIVGFLVGATAGLGHPTSVGVIGTLLIIGLHAGDKVVISNVSLTTGNQPGGIIGLDCQGSIVLEDVAFVAEGYPDAYMHFERCANVTLHACEIALGGAPLRFKDSTGLMSWCSIYHTDPGGLFPPTFSYQQTVEGLRLRNSTVTVIASTIRGQSRYLNQTQWVQRPGAYIESGTLKLGPVAYLLGGASGGSFPAYGYELQNPATGHVELDSRGYIQRAPDNQTYPCYCPPVPRQLPSVHSEWQVAGQPYELYAFGPAGGFAMMLFGDHAATPLVTDFGLLAIEPSSLEVLDIVSLSATSGLYQWHDHTLLQAPVAHAFAFQSLVLSPTGELALSVPSPFTVGWPHGVIP